MTRLHNLVSACAVTISAAACARQGSTSAGAPVPSAAYDLVIANGKVVDGTGNPWFRGDIGVRGDRIVAIRPAGGLANVAATRRVDATGLVVAPGFIDIQAHSWEALLWQDGRVVSKVTQGVTTEIIGHCGFSVAPALPGKVALLKDYLSPSAPWLPFRELTFPDYLDTFPATSVNAGMLVGHNTLRLMVMGMDKRAPAPDELKAMIALLESGLEAGALGMSSGLFTSPGSYAQPEEMIAFGHVLKKYNAAYFTHLRDESNKVIEAVEEALQIAEQCGVHVEIVHFKCSGMDNWGKARQALDMIAKAKARGLDPDVATTITQQLIDDTEGAVSVVRRETANLTTRYSFTRGPLQGFALGTSTRYAMGKPRAALSSGGVVVLPARRTSSYILVNPFASYRRKLFGYAWTAQLNVNNVLGLNSDQGNSYTWPRKTEPRQYVTTVSTNF